MADAITISVSQEGDAQAMLSMLGTAAHVRKLLECVGMAVEIEAVNSARRKGGRSFWASVANSVSHQMQPDGTMVVGASHVAAAHKQTGGVISAPGQGAGSLHRKFLTIPVGPARDGRWDTDEAESRGYRLFHPKGTDLLFGQLSAPKTGRRRKSPSAQPEPVLLFVLKKSVDQKPDPWFPEGAQLAQAVDDGMGIYRAKHGGRIA